MDKELFVIIALIAALLAIIFGGVYWLSRASCLASWDGSGYEIRYGVLAGCQARRADGTWVPTTALREVAK